MKHLILALLVATISLPVTAGKPTKEQVQSSGNDGVRSERGKPTKEQCSFTIDQAGVKRQATEPQKKECEARIAVSDPGVPSDKKPPKK